MLRDLYYRLLFRSDLNNVNGLRRYGERCMNSLLEKAKRHSSSVRKRTLVLKAKQKSVEAYLKSVQANHLLDDNEFFGIRKRIRMGTFFIGGIFVTECLLGYYSTLVLINGDDLGLSLLRWLLAAGLTFSAISSAEKLVEALLPHAPYKSTQKAVRSIPVILIWSVLLLGVQLAIIGVAEARVRDIEGGKTGGILYIGFIALSMVLPLIAGTIGWEISGFYDAYKQTRKYRKAQNGLDTLVHRIAKNVQREVDYYNVTLTQYWDKFNDFRTFKENYNLAKGMREEFNDRFCYDFEEFKHTAGLRYGPVKQEFETEQSSRKPVTLSATVLQFGVDGSRKQLYGDQQAQLPPVAMTDSINDSLAMFDASSRPVGRNDVRKPLNGSAVVDEGKRVGRPEGKRKRVKQRRQ